MPSIALPVSLRGQLLSGTGSSVVPPAFSPADLFATGSQGIWLDPSDLSTMFSDRAGTTPVTTPGTVVGLRLDKSKGPPGPQLVTNGTFDDGLTGWTTVGTPTVSVASGEISLVSAGAGGSVRATISTVVGKQYYVFGTSKQITSRGQIGVGTTAGGTELLSFSPLVGTVTVGNFFVAVGTTTHIFMGLRDTAAGVEVRYDNISVRELAGNHAVAPTDAARPVYGVEPKGGRRNLLTWSEDFGNAAWAKTSATVATNTTTAPDGTTTADTITASASTHFVSQSFTPTAAIHTASVYFKQGTDTAFEFQFNTASFALGVRLRYTFSTATTTVTLGGSPSSVTTNVVDVGGGWFRAVISVLCTATTWYFDVHGITGGQTSIIWGAQLELGSTATNYQRVLSAYDITESGVPTTHYVQYDGSDDSMSTAAIDFTATDKMSVFAGVRKLSDAGGLGALLEFSSNAPNSTGTIGLYASISSAANYYGFSRGTSTAEVQTANTFAAPHSAVLTSTSDISGDIYRLRVNGTVVGTSTANQGTGNYLANSVFIGRRGNSNLPFNGKDYGIIVVGKAASAGEIADTELWLSDKTAEVDVAKSISPNIYTRSGDTILDRANSIIERRTV